MEVLLLFPLAIFVVYRVFASTNRRILRTARKIEAIGKGYGPPPPRLSGQKANVAPSSAPQAAVVGPCYVIDGDTIDIRGTRLRLAGIDAPELDHPYGKVAKFHLIKLCRGQEVRAVFEGALSHDRSVATCFLPDGRDLSAEMVKAGLAVDWRKFSGGKYRGFEPEGVRKKLWRCDARQKGLSAEYMPD